MRQDELAARVLEKKERRRKDRRVFTYTACFPERRIRFDRRHSFPLHLVVLEDEEIESLLDVPNEIS